MSHTNDNSSLKQKITKIMSEAKPRAQKKADTSSTNTIHGDNNIIGDSNVINNIFNPKPEKKIVKVQTGVNTITAEQKATLHALVNEIVILEKTLKKKPRLHGAVWGALNKHVKVNSYHEIALEKFEAAHSFLIRRRASLINKPSAKKKLPNWRTSKYSAIKARAREFLEGEGRYHVYISAKFQKASLTELTDDELEIVYRYVMNWKRQ